MLAPEHIVRALLGDGFTEFNGAGRENIRNDQNDGKVRLVIQLDGDGLSFIISVR